MWFEFRDLLAKPSETVVSEIIFLVIKDKIKIKYEPLENSNRPVINNVYPKTHRNASRQSGISHKIQAVISRY